MVVGPVFAHNGKEGNRNKEMPEANGLKNQPLITGVFKDKSRRSESPVQTLWAPPLYTWGLPSPN